MSDVVLVKELASFICDIAYEDIPKDAIEQAKKCLLDTLGVGLSGSQMGISQKYITLVKEWRGAEEATLIGDGAKVPSVNAALVNGTVGHVLELDDGHRFANGHPGVTTIPAALAIAERNACSGKALLTAIVLGYEIFTRLAMTINPSHMSRGFHTTGTCGTFGAATAAGKLCCLDERGMISALGLAALQASGLLEVMHGESLSKPFNAGRAAMNGVLAANLSSIGILAPETIFEGKEGFLRAYADQYDTEKMVEGLGEEYQITSVYFKIHACCRHIHPAIDGILHLVNEHSLTPEDIEKVVVKTYFTAYKLTGTEYEPKTESTAKFSLPYCIAAALKYQKVSPVEFTKEKISDNNILKIAKRVEVQVDPEIDKQVPGKRGALLEVQMKSGKRYEYMVENPRGEPENPIGIQELHSKFKMLSRSVLTEEMLNSVIDHINKLDHHEDVRNLTSLLS